MDFSKAQGAPISLTSMLLAALDRLKRLPLVSLRINFGAAIVAPNAPDFFSHPTFFWVREKKTPQKPIDRSVFFVGGLGSSNDFDLFWVICMFKSWDLSLDLLFLSGTWELYSLSTLPLLGPTLAFFWKRRMMKTSVAASTAATRSSGNFMLVGWFSTQLEKYYQPPGKDRHRDFLLPWSSWWSS